MSWSTIAWFNLVESPRRMLASTAGIAFAILLMFLELGFLNGIYDSQTNLIERLNADLVVVDAQKEAQQPRRPFPRIRLNQIIAHPDVVSAWPVYTEEARALWKNERDGRKHPIFVVAFDPDDPVFRIPEVKALSERLKIPDTALIDSRSKNRFGPLVANALGELNGRRIRIVGTFPLGPTFRVDGTMIVSDQTFLHCFRSPKATAPEDVFVEYGVIRIRDGVDPEQCAADLTEMLPPDVAVYTRRGFCDRIRHFWGTKKAAGRVFQLGMAAGFLIGTVICYQILYSEIVDRLPQYGTLKGIGYTSRYIFSVVICESIYLSVIGFIPGLMTSWCAYRAVAAVSGMVMKMTLERVLFVFTLSVLMCVVSALFAARYAAHADPTSLF